MSNGNQKLRSWMPERYASFRSWRRGRIGMHVGLADALFTYFTTYRSINNLGMQSL